MVTFKWNFILVFILRQIGYHRYIDVGDTLDIGNMDTLDFGDSLQMSTDF